jgi:BatD DUF11 like domain
MKSLGKLVLLILLSNITLFAMVKASLDTRVVYSGETVTYRLSMSGGDIIKPALTQICGNDIIATSSQTSIESLNGSYSKTYTLSYQFMPQNSCTIEPVEVNINGKVEKSNSVELTVKEPSQDKKAPFLLTLKPSKSSLYVGEPFELTLTLQQSLRAQAVDSKFLAPDFKGVWVKSESKPSRVDNGENITTTVVYTLAPQREGNLSIEPAQLRVASRVPGVNGWGTFAPQVKWRSYYSNKPSIEVKAIPKGATLIGDFSIKTELQKREINSNEALNLTVVVEGVGNLEDVKSFKPYVENVNVFDEKIVINGNKLSQKLAFVSDRDFTVPAFELIYFNTKTQKVQKIKTEPIEVKVKGDMAKKELNIQRDETPKENIVVEKKVVKTVTDKTTLILTFIFGIAVGITLMLLNALRGRKRKSSFDIKDEKLLLMKLLPYKDDKDVQRVLDILEKNLYSENKEKIDKKLLKEIIGRYNIR